MERKKRNGRYRKRLQLLLGLAVLFWSVLAARLYYWQVVCHEELSAAAVSQYQVTAEGLDTRGAILDRNLQPLTGGTQQYYYFIKKERTDSRAMELLTAAGAEKVSAPQNISSGWDVYRTVYFDETVTWNLKEAYGVYTFSGMSRYSDNQTACHLIGYLNQSENRGVSGLEQMYEEILKPEDRSLTLWADGVGSLLLNVPPKQSGKWTLTRNHLVTTLDYGLQKFCESAFSTANLEGTVLVSDTESGEILAWVSSPSFNPNQIDAHLTEGGSNLVNRCIQGLYAPGSVFKVVVAAAALESGIVHPRDVYECTGKTEVNGVKLGCKAGPADGHGMVDMYDAMAVSCNCYFSQLGARLGTEKILDMARHLGFGAVVFESFPEESAGYLPASDECGPWDVSNLSIGQGKILVTPVQVQQMMGIVASGGMLHPLTVAADSGSDAKRILSEYTAVQLVDMLQQVMEEGTGSGMEWPGLAAGKTGTAEASRDGLLVNNCWFSGFCRTEEKCYTVTVLVEQGVSGSASAVPVFHDIYEYMMVRNM